jgi:hypothetical protein
MENDKPKPILMHIKDFFNYQTLADFKKDWEKLNDEEKEYFRKAVAEELGIK